ncbi:hypothetical protein IGI04_013737 [Brassica rapa subsp. trilocularis]|uniref:Uncharacterized protein n=1 Tax=Brassica rapa subsp. trilocularis TaxID=1813537 RepID=A0ABQ7N9P0_BRACM|nr:hypothetical protein IGI04_013737 [Brassica rapa subsp. trilocularis]
MSDQVVRVIVIQKTLIEHAQKLHQVKSLLEEGGNFSEIYMKVQLKPLKWDGEGEEERPVEALMILKYGGVLTHADRKQVVKSRSGLKILITGKEGKPKTKTLNVVYKQIFQNIP